MPGQLALHSLVSQSPKLLNDYTLVQVYCQGLGPQTLSEGFECFQALVANLCPVRMSPPCIISFPVYLDGGVSGHLYLI